MCKPGEPCPGMEMDIPMLGNNSTKEMRKMMPFSSEVSLGELDRLKVSLKKEKEVRLIVESAAGAYMEVITELPKTMAGAVRAEDITKTTHYTAFVTGFAYAQWLAEDRVADEVPVSGDEL